MKYQRTREDFSWAPRPRLRVKNALYVSPQGLTYKCTGQNLIKACPCGRIIKNAKRDKCNRCMPNPLCWCSCCSSMEKVSHRHFNHCSTQDCATMQFELSMGLMLVELYHYRSDIRPDTHHESRPFRFPSRPSGAFTPPIPRNITASPFREEVEHPASGLTASGFPSSTPTVSRDALWINNGSGTPGMFLAERRFSDACP